MRGKGEEKRGKEMGVGGGVREGNIGICISLMAYSEIQLVP